jgi:hypothetical protein
VKPDRSAPSRNNPVLWAAASMALIASPALACQPVLLDGARCLFIGHSFFVPVAAAFDQLADPTLFPDHAYDRYFASGAMGSPGQLWDDADGSRTEIEGKLATGQVELLGLTMYGGLGSQLQDYRNWMDLALAYNPDTRFLIGIPWVAAGPSMTAEDFAALNDTWGDDTIQIVTELRAIYPKTRIDLINYGVVASELKFLYEAGDLPDVDCESGCSNPLFADGAIGHGGPMMTQLSAMAWMSVLYGAEPSELSYDEYITDVEAIVEDALAYNAALPQPPQDWNDDGTCDFFDVAEYLLDHAAGLPSADLNGDAVFGAHDVEMMLATLGG